MTTTNPDTGYEPVPGAPPSNVFEWCWEHSTDLLDEDRQVLLGLAFQAVEYPERSEVFALRLAETDAHVNGRLMSAGFIAVDGPEQAVWFPAYETWRTEDEVAW